MVPATMLSWRLALALVLLPRLASAADDSCSPDNQISTCINSDSLWHVPEASGFVSVPQARRGNPGGLSTALALGFITRPIVLNAPSSDPEGRDIEVVKDALDLNLLLAYDVTRELSLSIATPMVLYQRGTGAEGVTSQRGTAPPTSAVRDPKIYASYALPLPRDLEQAGLGLRARLGLSLPLGDSHLYAGERGLVAAPSLVFEAVLGAVTLGSELGLRLREKTRLANVALGSQIWASLGARVQIVKPLQLAAEAWLAPGLSEQPGGGTWVTSEWLASANFSPLCAPELSLKLGGGTGIPLAQSPGGKTIAGLTSPGFRGVFVVRYTSDTL